MTKITYIPGEIANAAIDEHGNRKPVTRTHHIFDDAKDKNQAEINAEVDNTFAFHQSEINALNSQNYVTVDSFSSLPATGAVDTIYRVSNWDGTQQDPTVYSEYAWNGESYVHLNTKTQIGEVFDISAYHATGGEFAKYADLDAALGTNGENVPQSLRKGGMSVKFVQSSDNKYVQWRYMLSSTTNADIVNVNNWQGVDDEPVSNSKNLIESGGVSDAIEKTQIGGILIDQTTLTHSYLNANKYATASGGQVRKINYTGCNLKLFDVSQYAGKKVHIITHKLTEAVAFLFEGADYSFISSYSTSDTLVEITVEVPQNALWLDVNFDASYDCTVDLYTDYDIRQEMLKSVRITPSQGLTEQQKVNARQNLGFGNGQIDNELVSGSDNLTTSGVVYNSLFYDKRDYLEQRYTTNGKYATISNNRLYKVTLEGCNYGIFPVDNLVGKTIHINTTLLTGYLVTYVIIGAEDVVKGYGSSPTINADMDVEIPADSLWIYVNYADNTTPEVFSTKSVSKVKVVGENTPLESVWNAGLSCIAGTFTLNSRLAMNDNQCLRGEGCVITCGENAQIVAGNSSIIEGIKFVGSWNPVRVSGDGTTYTQFGYEPIKFVHEGESEPSYMTIQDLHDSVSDALVGPGKTSDDCLIDVTIDKCYNTTIKNCIFEGFDRIAVRMAARRHKENSNGQIFGNYFYSCWCGVFLSGEFIRLHGNEYTACPIGVCSYASNLNQYGEIFKCCDCAILMAQSYTGHSELTATEMAHSGLANLYMRSVPKTLGMQICNCHIVDGMIGGFDLNNVLIVSGRLDVYFQYTGTGSGNSIICSNIGKGYLYGNPLYDVPVDTQITLNRGLNTCTDAEANNE